MPENRRKTGARDGNGRFVKGTSGNPGGRPRAETSVVELARQRTEAALETLGAIMADDEAPASARVRAAEVMLDRGWGRPRQTLEAEVETFDLAGARKTLMEKLRQSREADPDEDS